MKRFSIILMAIVFCLLTSSFASSRVLEHIRTAVEVHEVVSINLYLNENGSGGQVIFVECSTCPPKKVDLAEDAYIEGDGDRIEEKDVSNYQGQSGSVGIDTETGEAVTIEFEQE